MDILTMTEAERRAAFAALDNDALSAALADINTQAGTLFALESPTIEQVDQAETLLTWRTEVESVVAERSAAVEDAARRFAAARESFAVNDGVETGNGEGATEPGDDGDDSDDAGDGDDGDDSGDAGDGDSGDAGDGDSGDAGDGGDSAVTTAAAHTRNQRVPAARKVGAKAKRPAAPAASPVTITAAPDVQGFAAGQTLAGMTDVAKAVQARVKSFAPWNRAAAEKVHEQSGGEPVLKPFGAAQFQVEFPDALTASGGPGQEYDASKEAIKRHIERVNAQVQAAVSGKAPSDPTLTAAGWCAPSPTVYNWIADYTVDGLATIPEVDAPRGGLMTTRGPELAQGTYADLANFGFGGTEAQAEAGYVKTCETIECPDFVDHRLDFTGYCWKIPILTEKAYPELVADALRLSDVLYAHKMNSRFLADIAAGSTDVDGTGLGAVFLDTLEALTQIAVKERRWWNVGENAVMEVKFPQYARDIFKFDMARRTGLSLDDIATDQKVAAHFAAHNLAVEYVSDFANIHGAATPTASWPALIRALMYPAGTWVKAVEDVINLSAVYDAASLSANEYTGVFFEQGVMTVQMGYRSHEITVPVCTAGLTGAPVLDCLDATENAAGDLAV